VKRIPPIKGKNKRSTKKIKLRGWEKIRPERIVSKEMNISPKKNAIALFGYSFRPKYFLQAKRPIPMAEK
jgi:hypothetical protein